MSSCRPTTFSTALSFPSSASVRYALAEGAIPSTPSQLHRTTYPGQGSMDAMMTYVFAKPCTTTSIDWPPTCALPVRVLIFFFFSASRSEAAETAACIKVCWGSGSSMTSTCSGMVRAALCMGGDLGAG
eukprot:TRINITY_DN2989_c0_g1_i1.p4 TRINITY_DN2989_c0_g1~~TRINITY_DN2989_c0_g1_i1.p4  ORF type:complete len:129 (-),score=15.31 TRINITY_DN2989_c0_g1_i1:969-1355(-)